MCITCDRALGLNAHQIMWQLLMEKVFIRQVYLQLDTNSQSQSEDSSQSTSLCLNDVEENAVRYIAGFCVRKLEQVYSKRKLRMLLSVLQLSKRWPVN
jgi:hypothetical protein